MKRLSKNLLTSSCKKSVCVVGLLHLVLPVNLNFYCSFPFLNLFYVPKRHIDTDGPQDLGQMFVGKKLKNNSVTKVLREGLSLTECNFLNLWFGKPDARRVLNNWRETFLPMPHTIHQIHCKQGATEGNLSMCPARRYVKDQRRSSAFIGVTNPATDSASRSTTLAFIHFEDVGNHKCQNHTWHFRWKTLNTPMGPEPGGVMGKSGK